MNALDMLKDDHQRILTELDLLKSENRAETLADLVGDLRNHQRALKEVLYPELEEQNQALDFIEVQVKNDRRIEQLIVTLQQEGAAPERFAAQFIQLRDAWLDHIGYEESRIFPEAQALGKGRLLELSYEIEAIQTGQSGLDSAIYPARRL